MTTKAKNNLALAMAKETFEQNDALEIFSHLRVMLSPQQQRAVQLAMKIVALRKEMQEAAAEMDFLLHPPTVRAVSLKTKTLKKAPGISVPLLKAGKAVQVKTLQPPKKAPSKQKSKATPEPAMTSGERQEAIALRALLRKTPPQRGQQTQYLGRIVRWAQPFLNKDVPIAAIARVIKMEPSTLWTWIRNGHGHKNHDSKNGAKNGSSTSSTSSAIVN